MADLMYPKRRSKKPRKRHSPSIIQPKDGGCYLCEKGSERICEQYFFHKTFYKIENTGFYSGYSHGMIMKLLFDGAVPDYRSGDELREHRYIQPEVKDVTLCFCIAPVNIYYV